MPESNSGLRGDNVWNTKASISMPTPAMLQAIIVLNAVADAQMS
jgi:hypothetical protein